MAAPTSGLLENSTGGIPLVRDFGLNTAKAANLSGFTVSTAGAVVGPSTLNNVSGTATFNTVSATTLSASGAITPTGGVAAAGGFSNPTAFHSGQVGPVATTGLTQTQIVTTDTYYVEVFIPANTTLTGISVLNGHTTSGSLNLNIGLANSTGVIVAKSATTTAQGAADAYQQIPFTTTYSAVGPAKYYIAIQGSATTGFLATHTIGNFGANLLTSETYGTFLTTASYATTTFTTARGPVADTY